VSTLEQQERYFIAQCRQLYDATQAAALAKKTLMEAYIALHHPTVPFEITILNENFSLDLVFPGLSRDVSRQLAQEVNDYLQRLML
jgi:hypothetical protein